MQFFQVNCSHKFRVGLTLEKVREFSIKLWLYWFHILVGEYIQKIGKRVLCSLLKPVFGNWTAEYLLYDKTSNKNLCCLSKNRKFCKKNSIRLLQLVPNIELHILLLYNCSVISIFREENKKYYFLEAQIHLKNKNYNVQDQSLSKNCVIFGVLSAFIEHYG